MKSKRNQTGQVECITIEDSQSSQSAQAKRRKINNLSEVLKTFKQNYANLHWVELCKSKQMCLLINDYIGLKEGTRDDSNEWKEFFRNDFKIFFTKMLSDDVEFSDYPTKRSHCYEFMKLMVNKLKGPDCIAFFEILALILNPVSKFHNQNAGNFNADDFISYVRQLKELRVPGKMLERFLIQVKMPLLEIQKLLEVIILIFYIVPRGDSQNIFFAIVMETMTVLKTLGDRKIERHHQTIFKILEMSRIILSRSQNLDYLQKLEDLELEIITKSILICNIQGKIDALDYSHYIFYFFEPQKITRWVERNHLLQNLWNDSLGNPLYLQKLNSIFDFFLQNKMLITQILILLIDGIQNPSLKKYSLRALIRITPYLNIKHQMSLLIKLQDKFNAIIPYRNIDQQEEFLEFFCQILQYDRYGSLTHKVLNYFLGKMREIKNIQTINLIRKYHGKILKNLTNSRTSIDFGVIQNSEVDKSSKKLEEALLEIKKLQKVNMKLNKDNIELKEEIMKYKEDHEEYKLESDNFIANLKKALYACKNNSGEQSVTPVFHPVESNLSDVQKITIARKKFNEFFYAIYNLLFVNE